MEGDILARFNVPSQADYSNLGRQVFTLFKYQDVLSVLRDPKTFTSTLLNEGLGQFLGGFLLTGMEDSKHKRSEEHTSELQSLMRISYAVFCLKKKKHTTE